MRRTFITPCKSYYQNKKAKLSVIEIFFAKKIFLIFFVGLRVLGVQEGVDVWKIRGLRN